MTTKQAREIVNLLLILGSIILVCLENVEVAIYLILFVIADRLLRVAKERD